MSGGSDSEIAAAKDGTISYDMVAQWLKESRSAVAEMREVLEEAEAIICGELPYMTGFSTRIAEVLSKYSGSK